ncbi:hypothetical protein BJ742DRAFT_773714 [Cladochytrium replicatum]|nr:hypothetical protein BJ742DRAFT_773714 [Cladochytrium replicatum]
MSKSNTTQQNHPLGQGKPVWPTSALSICSFTSEHGHVVDILEWWKSGGVLDGKKSSGPELEWGVDGASDGRCELGDASMSGQVSVLDWWKSSGLEIHWNERAMDLASCKGHVAVLEWWKASR